MIQFYDLTKNERTIQEELSDMRETLETMNIIFMGLATKQTVGNKL